MLPRLPGETREAWIDRTRLWEQSAEGRAAARAAAEASARHRANRDLAWLVEAGVPRRAATSAVGDLELTDALRYTLGPPVAILVLSGGNGTGKTVAAAAWLRGHPPDDVLFVTAAALARWPRYDVEQMDRLFSPSRLVIDDLGVEFKDAKGAFKSVLEEVVCWRHGEGNQTVITTNMKRDDFRAEFDGRIADRIREDGRFVVCGGESMRRKKAP